MSLYSIVVPVYNSERTLKELYTRLNTVFEEIHEDFELILVDDSSRDNSFAVMEELHKMDSRVKIIQLAKNFGQHPALLCGFTYVTGDFVITMDDDLQHRPEELPKLIAVMNERKDVDVILARYANRKHNLLRKIGTRVSVFATSKMLKKDPNLEITSFRLMRRFIMDSIMQTSTHLPQIGNLLVQTSNRIINVDVQHDARKFGHSNYTFKHLAKDLIYDITTNSIFPLIVVRDIGIGSFILSIVLSIYYLIRYFFFSVSVEGFTTIVLLILGFSGLILLSMGILGEYLMHILDEAKKMPHFVVRREEID